MAAYTDSCKYRPVSTIGMAPHMSWLRTCIWWAESIKRKKSHNAPLCSQGIENHKLFEGAVVVKRNVPSGECTSAPSSWEGISEMMAYVPWQTFINWLAVCFEHGLQIIIHLRLIIWNHPMRKEGKRATFPALSLHKSMGCFISQKMAQSLTISFAEIPFHWSQY